jgi:hypothetical protein
MAEEAKLSTAQKRALLDRNISSRTVARKAEQSLADDKEHRVCSFLFVLFFKIAARCVVGPIVAGAPVVYVMQWK